MPTVKQEIAELEESSERRMFRKGDRVQYAAPWSGAPGEMGTVYEDEKYRFGPWGQTVVVHWDDKPAPTGGPNDRMSSHYRLRLASAAEETD